MLLTADTRTHPLPSRVRVECSRPEASFWQNAINISPGEKRVDPGVREAGPHHATEMWQFFCPWMKNIKDAYCTDTCVLSWSLSPCIVSIIRARETGAMAGCLGEIWSLLSAGQLVMYTWANSGTSLSLDFHISTLPPPYRVIVYISMRWYSQWNLQRAQRPWRITVLASSLELSCDHPVRMRPCVDVVC